MAKNGKNGFFAEFKTFIMRGNVIDMAIGVVVGGAFTAIVNALVANILNPILGLVTGGIDFGMLKIVLREATETTPELAITYGVLINAIINFLLIALVIFCIVRGINKMRAAADAKKAAAEAEAKAAEEAAKAAAEAAKAAEPAPVDPQLALLEEIRDLLKKN